MKYGAIRSCLCITLAMTLAGCADSVELPAESPDEPTVVSKLAVSTTDAGIPQALDDEAAVRATLDELMLAIAVSDYHTQMRLTNPVLIQRVGGEEAFLKMLKRVSAEVESDAGVPSLLKVLSISEIVPSGGKWFATVKAEMSVGGLGMVPALFICERLPGDAPWRLLDGAGFKGGRSLLLSLLPDFPDELELP